MVTTTRKTVTPKSMKAVARPPVKATQKPIAPPAAPQVAAKVAAKPVPNAWTKPMAQLVAEPKTEKPAKVKKPKLVRDSFTIPKTEYSVLDDLKQRAGKLAHPAKKSELLRAGIKALAAMSDAVFLLAVQAVPAIKTGRPSKG